MGGRQEHNSPRHFRLHQRASRADRERPRNRGCRHIQLQERTPHPRRGSGLAYVSGKIRQERRGHARHQQQADDSPLYARLHQQSGTRHIRPSCQHRNRRHKHRDADQRIQQDAPRAQQHSRQFVGKQPCGEGLRRFAHGHAPSHHEHHQPGHHRPFHIVAQHAGRAGRGPRTDSLQSFAGQIPAFGGASAKGEGIALSFPARKTGRERADTDLHILQHPGLRDVPTPNYSHPTTPASSHRRPRRCAQSHRKSS